MNERIAALVFLLSFLVADPGHGQALEPGLYEIEVKVELPHILPAVAAKAVSRCITRTQIEAGRAFGILSASPLARCPLSPVLSGAGEATFKVRCPGRAAAHAEARFETAADGFRGTIRMNMGGKNMTVVERQRGRRVGPCE